MTEQEEIYFEKLTERRTSLAISLKDPAVSNFFDSSGEQKYSDKAHFIYELLQNADDAGATSVRFVLYKDKLVFAHNGTKRFSISNPSTEKEDSENNKLGDINAITSYGNSNKIAKIGKYGYGFKAVIDYTLTPYIYDPNIFFKIDEKIIPKKINGDFDGREKNETLFVFLFDHPDRTADDAFANISKKLGSLDYPLLFLPNLKEISIQIPGLSYQYGKYVEQTMKFDDTDSEFIYLTQTDKNNPLDEKLWLFSRTVDDGYKYSVGFFLDKDGNLTAKEYPAFCFFSTTVSTGLKFIIHAPFLPTDNREGIRADSPHNKKMIALLAKLAADSLVYLREIGKTNGKQLINDNIFNIIPYDKNKTEFSDINNDKKISFLPFYTAIFEKMCNKELLPSRDGYVAKKNAY